MKIGFKVPGVPVHGRAPSHAPTVPTTATRAQAPTPPSPPGRNVAVVSPPGLPGNVPGSGRVHSESPLKKILTDINARAISPREMQALSEDLYAGGVLTWEEYAELAFQAELHPDFPRTIGALTGERALPDTPRDYVKVWEERLDFERRHFPEGAERDRAVHILSILRRIDAPLNMKA